MSTHARPLADWLAAASATELTHLFTARAVEADAGWHDFFDAAESLLDAASLAKVLPTLTSAEAAALLRAAAGGDADPERDSLIALALLRPDGTPPPPVLAAVAGRTVPEVVSVPIIAAASADASAHAAELAFTTVGLVADLLLSARDTPFALLIGGALSSGEKRRLSDAGVPTENADALIALATNARLALPIERRLRTTTAAEDWLRSSAVERWAILVSAFRGSLPRGIRTASGGWIAPSLWPHAHPWDATWQQRSGELLDAARRLGLIAEGDTEPAWAAPLRRGDVPDAGELARLLPAEVDQIFLQNDLTAIAPGPLKPALDIRLRTMAARESAAQASSYRLTSESVAHAFVVGETEESILDFLTQISLTGIPQPLSYLVAQSAQRHGLVRVATDEETGRTLIESADQHLIEAMSVDQSLRPLALSAQGTSLTSKVGRDTVYWALTDARYPATLVGADGTPLVSDRNPAPFPDVSPAGDIDFAPLIARLRAQQGPDADAAWLDRELEAAVRAKALLAVTVGMPDGSTRELLLEATGLGGGRLRGRDRAADVERTLPVSSIRSATIVAA